MKMRVYMNTRREPFGIVPRAQPDLKTLYYAYVNILIESNFVIFNRRILVTKDTASLLLIVFQSAV